MHGTELAASQDNYLWSSRCWFWADTTAGQQTPKLRRDHKRLPLILSGHGISLRVQGESLLIRGGLTHYPQKAESYRYFRGDFNLPSRIVVLEGSGNISLEVLSWLTEQEIPLIRITWRGAISCVIGGAGYSASALKLEWQRRTRADAALRLNFGIELITRKIENSIITLEKAVRRSDVWEKAMTSTYETLTNFEERPPKSVEELLAMEGNAAAAYFRAWSGMPVKWLKRPRRPIPDNWREIGSRNSPFYQTGNHHAQHPVNAILNYAYTVLASQLQIYAVAEGYDPTIGILHDRKGSTSFVFDLIEPHRAEIDRVVLNLIRQTEFDATDFVIRSDGVCRLNPEMARCIAGLIVAEATKNLGPIRSAL